MSMDWLQAIGQKTLHFFQRMGRAVIFLIHVLSGLKMLFQRPSLLIREMYSVGVQSLLIFDGV